MISIQNIVIHPKSRTDEFIGYQGENLARTLVIDGDIDPSAVYFLETEDENGKKLSWEMAATDTAISLDVTSALLKTPGRYKAQIRIQNGTTVRKSNIFKLEVLDSICATEQASPVEQTAFEAQITRISGMLANAEDSASEAAESATEAAESATQLGEAVDTAVQKASEASASASSASASAAAAKVNADRAEKFGANEVLFANIEWINTDDLTDEELDEYPDFPIRLDKSLAEISAAVDSGKVVVAKDYYSYDVEGYHEKSNSCYILNELYEEVEEFDDGFGEYFAYSFGGITRWGNVCIYYFGKINDIEVWTYELTDVNNTISKINRYPYVGAGDVGQVLTITSLGVAEWQKLNTEQGWKFKSGVLPRGERSSFSFEFDKCKSIKIVLDGVSSTASSGTTMRFGITDSRDRNQTIYGLSVSGSGGSTTSEISFSVSGDSYSAQNDWFIEKTENYDNEFAQVQRKYVRDSLVGYPVKIWFGIESGKLNSGTINLFVKDLV